MAGLCVTCKPAPSYADVRIFLLTFEKTFRKLFSWKKGSFSNEDPCTKPDWGGLRQSTSFKRTYGDAKLAFGYMLQVTCNWIPGAYLLLNVRITWLRWVRSEDVIQKNIQYGDMHSEQCSSDSIYLFDTVTADVFFTCYNEYSLLL